jgi:hypothetical protein
MRTEGSKYPPRYLTPYLEQLNPGEIHNIGGECLNPKCNYVLSDQDRAEVDRNEGWFTCPKCDRTYNFYTDQNINGPGGYTRSGLSMSTMGQIGEEVVHRMGHVPGVGDITWWAGGLQSPLDFIIGPYGVEVKTNHSEAAQRFKLGGAQEVEDKRQMAIQEGVTPAFIGVRLNFYTDVADLFFRPQLTDTWIGNPLMPHIAKVDFSQLNPYKHPEDVPQPTQLPDDDSTPPVDADVPF